MLGLLVKLIPLLDKLTDLILGAIASNKAAQISWYNIVSKFSEFHSSSANAAREYHEQKTRVQEEAAKRLNPPTN